MDEQSLSISSISALKQAQVIAEVGVKVISSIQEQDKAIAAILVDQINKLPSPGSGKGQRLNIVA